MERPVNRSSRPRAKAAVRPPIVVVSSESEAEAPPYVDNLLEADRRIYAASARRAEEARKAEAKKAKEARDAAADKKADEAMTAAESASDEEMVFKEPGWMEAKKAEEAREAAEAEAAKDEEANLM